MITSLPSTVVLGCIRPPLAGLDSPGPSTIIFRTPLCPRVESLGKAMDDYVAVCVKLKRGGSRFFLTFGRLFDVVDGTELESLVLKHAAQFALGGEPVKAEVCYSLNDASSAPYFYEALLVLIRYGPPPDARKWKTWKRVMTESIRNGNMLMYCGDQKHRETCRKSFWSMKRSANAGVV